MAATSRAAIRKRGSRHFERRSRDKFSRRVHARTCRRIVYRPDVYQIPASNGFSRYRNSELFRPFRRAGAKASRFKLAGIRDSRSATFQPIWTNPKSTKTASVRATVYRKKVADCLPKFLGGFSRLLCIIYKNGVFPVSRSRSGNCQGRKIVCCENC